MIWATPTRPPFPIDPAHTVTVALTMTMEFEITTACSCAASKPSWDASDYLDYLVHSCCMASSVASSTYLSFIQEIQSKTGESVFETLNISSMRRLPEEILSIIRGYSDASMISQFRTVSGLVQRFLITSTDHLWSPPLQTVSA